MEGIEFGLFMLGVLLVLIAFRLPIAIAMITVGIIGYLSISGWMVLLNYLNTAAYWRFSTYDLSVVPLFLLMGQFATRAGMSKALFDAANVFVGHYRGGIAIAAIGGCAGFGAICGSSLATAATMGQVALPELRRFNYSGALATGALAAGGTLGILIPPSIILVIYAVLVEANIATLFLAAFIPGIIAAIGYAIVVMIYVRVSPESGPAGTRSTRSQRWQAVKDIWSVLVIFVLVIGGIYAGVFTPTEGAAFGAIGTGLLAYFHGGMRTDGFIESLLGAGQTTGLIFLIIFGADILNAFLALTQLPQELAVMISDSPMPPLMVLAAILIFYLIGGCVMDSLSMILLTMPIFWPILAGMDFGMDPEDVKIWFGIIALIVVETGLITPPVGMNVFVINSMARDIPIVQTFKGVVPFIVSDVVRVLLLLLFPSLTLVLVRLIGN
jgi:tripartite ATP-independent transporter DctM subunit